MPCERWAVAPGQEPSAQPERVFGDAEGWDDRYHVDPDSGARKQIKLARFDLIPARPLMLLAEHYGKGAEKYGDHNWRGGYEFSNSYAALQRHCWQFWGGEDVDAETGSFHTIAIAWHAFTLTEYQLRHPDKDDRWMS